MSSAFQYLAWKPDPNNTATNAIQQDWNKSIDYVFSPFSMINQTFCKWQSNQGRNRPTYNYHYNLANPTMVCAAASYVHGQPAFTSTGQQFSTKSFRAETSIHNQVWILAPNIGQCPSKVWALSDESKSYRHR